MELSEDTNEGGYTLQAYEAGKVTINNEVHQQNLILGAEHLITHHLPESLKDLTVEHWEPLLALKPEIVIIGTGEHLEPLPHQLLESFYQRHIGVELMNTGAACRTINVLFAENRRAFAVLFF